MILHCYDNILARFRHKLYNSRVMERSWFGFKYMLYQVKNYNHLVNMRTNLMLIIGR